MNYLKEPVMGVGKRGGRGKNRRPTNLLVVALGEAKQEARKILDDVQYWELVNRVKRLSEFGDPLAMADLSIRKFGAYWELRCKGGFLNRINLRVYFKRLRNRGEIVVLKTYKKEEDGKVCPSVKETLDDRLEDYLAGARTNVSTYRKSK